MLYIDQQQVQQLSNMDEYIELMRQTFRDLSLGKSTQTLRTAMKIDDGGIYGMMPGVLKDGRVFGSKLITVFHDNPSKGKPGHQGVVVLFDSRDGSIKAIVDAIAITAIRTAAVSAVATELLANEHAQSLSLLGAGVQARSHLEAMLKVRPIKEVFVWSRSFEEAKKFTKEMSEIYKVKLIPCQLAKDAVAGADIICTLTPSKTPILLGEWIKEGAHINAVGACTPGARELDTNAIVRASLFVDRIESTINESGDYLIPLSEGAIDKNHIIGEIGDILTGTCQGRTDETTITVFEALGLAVEDLAAANMICNKLKNG